LARPGFSLLSVLALLALACFPGFAQANSSGAQYESELPNVPKSESTPERGGNPGSPGGGEDDEAQISENNPGVTGGGKGDSNGPGGEGNTHQGSPAPGAGGEQKADGSTPAGPGGEQPHSEKKPELKVASPASHASDDSSSPLVPILIAVAVLAAISVGAFYYRQRRGDAGSPISPKAS
jgi:hypothetical protein